MDVTVIICLDVSRLILAESADHLSRGQIQMFLQHLFQIFLGSVWICDDARGHCAGMSHKRLLRRGRADDRHRCERYWGHKHFHDKASVELFCFHLPTIRASTAVSNGANARSFGILERMKY